MIVKVGGWYYIVNAALAFLSALVTLFGGLFGTTLMSVVFAGLLGAMGYGLLQREKWGRFMALGCSLLGWTLGGLLLIGLVGYFLIALKLAGMLGLLGLLVAGGFMAALAWIVLITLLLGAVGVVISFKLFWHLCSPEGCEEFGVPPISARTVVASAGAWLGLVFINILSTGGGQFMYEAAGVGSTREPDQEALAELHEFERQQGMREGEALSAAAREQAQARAEAESAARLEAAQAEDAMSAEAAVPAEAAETEVPVEDAEAAVKSGEALAPEILAQPPVSEESAAPALPATATATPEAEEDDAPTSRKIVKCRDNSGGVTFTQGYCPPGTRKVEMTPSE